MKPDPSHKIPDRPYSIGIWCICAVNILIFFLAAPPSSMTAYIFEDFSFIPIEFSIHPVKNLHTLFSSGFLHLSIEHLLGNILLLVIFGMAIERLLGTGYFLLAFLGLGALAFIGSWLITPNSPSPIVGNSGAVSFLMGGYLMLFPRKKLRPLPFLRYPFLRAWVVILAWLMIQVYGLTALGEAGSGIAYWTHLGGFIVGLAASSVWLEFSHDTKRLLVVASGDSE